MKVSLLTATDAADHVHLIVGSNPIANARCTKSLDVGARPIVIAPGNADIHYALQQRIDSKAVQWLEKDFNDSFLTTLGRSEVGGFVDAVFITSGSCEQSE